MIDLNDWLKITILILVLTLLLILIIIIMNNVFFRLQFHSAVPSVCARQGRAQCFPHVDGQWEFPLEWQVIWPHPYYKTTVSAASTFSINVFVHTQPMPLKIYTFGQPCIHQLNILTFWSILDNFNCCGSYCVMYFLFCFWSPGIGVRRMIKTKMKACGWRNL